jgi:hypothetical protein
MSIRERIAVDLFCVGRKTIMVVMGSMSFQACRASFFSAMHMRPDPSSEEKAFIPNACIFSLSSIKYIRDDEYVFVCIYAKPCFFFISLRGWHTFFSSKQSYFFLFGETRGGVIPTYIINYTAAPHITRALATFIVFAAEESFAAEFMLDCT